MREDNYKSFDEFILSGEKVRIIPDLTLDYYKEMLKYKVKMETYEDKLDKIPIEKIERYLRNKKLKNIMKNEM
jgi:hypothetical protein